MISLSFPGFSLLGCFFVVGLAFVIISEDFHILYMCQSPRFHLLVALHHCEATKSVKSFLNVSEIKLNLLLHSRLERLSWFSVLLPVHLSSSVSLSVLLCMPEIRHPRLFWTEFSSKLMVLFAELWKAFRSSQCLLYNKPIVLPVSADTSMSISNQPTFLALSLSLCMNGVPDSHGSI